MRDLLAAVATVALGAALSAAPMLASAQGATVTASVTPQIEYNNHIDHCNIIISATARRR